MSRDDLFAAIAELPIIDIHSHLRREQMAAEQLDDLLFYHMLRYAMRAAGADEKLLWPESVGLGLHAPPPGDPGRLYEQWLSYWPQVANTGFGWILKRILRDLYEFDEPLTPASLPRLQRAFERKVRQADWGRQVLAKGRIVRVLSSQWRVGPLTPGQGEDGLRFTIEAAPAITAREFIPWYERLSAWTAWSGREIGSLAQMEEAMEAFYARPNWTDRLALVNWISSQADFTPVSRRDIDSILADVRAGRIPTEKESQLLEAALTRCICRSAGGHTRIFQLVYGTQFLTPGAPHPIARSHSNFAGTIGHLLSEFPGLHFNILSGCELDEPIWCSICLAYANVSLGSCWWGMFYPSVMHVSLHRRLDMVPTPKLMAFFSDGYCVDWIYGRQLLSRHVLSNVLAEKIEQGYYTLEQALQVAREVLLETPRRVFLPQEKIDV